jgi:acetate kinase
MTILVFNAGSSSLKFSLFRGRASQPVVRGEIEALGTRKARLLWVAGRVRGTEPSPGMPLHDAAVVQILGLLKKKQWLTEAPDRVGHRVVHGGDLFRKPTRLTDANIRALRQLNSLAPLHNPPALTVITAARRILRRSQHIAVFDTAFTADLPAASRWYAMPMDVQKRFGIRRFGFHGISHAAAVHDAARQLKRPVSKIHCITVHLGAGSSITATRKGRPIQTSMGYTPLEGLPMATRSGSIDPEIPLMLEDRGFSRKQVRELLTRQSGWFGLTGERDFRVVLAAAGWPTPAGWPRPKVSAAQRARCRLAVQIFVDHVKMTVAGYAALLGSTDAIVFTGAIGAGNPALRRSILHGLVRSGRPRVLVVPPNEEWAIARQCL